jgi:dTDP-4-amino-4,6-dideoxygalactose transaminase
MLRLNLDKLKASRDEFIKALHEHNIGASVHFIPIVLHPFFKKYMNDARNHCPQALTLYSRLVSMPLYPDLTEEQILYVVDAVKDIIFRFKTTKVFAVSHRPVVPA